jgi:hypothetical protein
LTTYYKKNSSEIDTNAFNFKTEIHQFDCLRKPPSIIKLKINNRIYEPPVNFSSENFVEIISGHGYKRTLFGKEKTRLRVTSNSSYGINTLKIKTLPNKK